MFHDVAFGVDHQQVGDMFGKLLVDILVVDRNSH